MERDGVIKWDEKSRPVDLEPGSEINDHCLTLSVGSEGRSAVRTGARLDCREVRTANQNPSPGPGQSSLPVEAIRSTANPRPRPLVGHYPNNPHFSSIFPCSPSPPSSLSSPQSLPPYGPSSYTIVSFILLYLNPPSSTEPPSFQTPPATSASSLPRLSNLTLILLPRLHTSQTPCTN